MKLKDILSHADAVSLLEIIDKASACRTEGVLRETVDDLRRLIPFEYSAGAVSRLNWRGAIESSNIVNISYPPEWISVYAEKRYYECDPIFVENFKRFDLQYWRDTYRKYNVPRAFLHHAIEYGLRDGYTHGMRNHAGNLGSLFSMSGDLLEPDIRTRTIINLFLPHIHQALIRLAGPHNLAVDVKGRDITRREREILRWIKAGKNTWDISRILKISQSTVMFHIRNLKKKLDVLTRAQAVAAALERKIIDLD